MFILFSLRNTPLRNPTAATCMQPFIKKKGKRNRKWLVPPLVPTLGTAALVECSHGLIGWPCLNLHEIGTAVAALGAFFFGRIHILPRSCTSEHIINILEPRVLPVRHLLLDVVYVRTRVAGKPIGIESFLHDENIGAGWAKEKHLLSSYFLVDHLMNSR